ncbi:MAG: hypothetical protein IT324_33655 [Anaerolineae bacterium]|nr:hypothetical protein [Anaerolineae bacterium]
MPVRIPDPEYITDTVEGAVYRLPGGTALVVGDVPEALTGLTPILKGSITVRYGLAFLTPPSDSLIPGLFAAEKGGMLVGREAWDYIQQHFQMHPRADILGLRSNGQQAQVFLRELDFGVPVRVLIYDRLAATTPVATADALIMDNGAPALPDLLTQYLPVKDVTALMGE